MAPKKRSRQPITRLNKDLKSGAHVLSPAERRAVFHVARELYSAHISSIDAPSTARRLEVCGHAIHNGVHAVLTQKRVLEIWPRQSSCPKAEAVTHQNKQVDSAQLQPHAFPPRKFDIVRQIDELRHAFANISTHSEATQLMPSINNSIELRKFSLASLCDQATLDLGMLDLLTERLSSQSHAAHNVLLAWVQELRLMRDLSKERDKKNKLKRMSTNTTNLSSAITDCLESTSILTNCWEGQNLMQAESHVLLKVLSAIQQKGLSPEEYHLDFSRKRSNSKDVEHDLAVHYNDLLHAFEAKQTVHGEDGASSSTESWCSKDVEVRPGKDDICGHIKKDIDFKTPCSKDLEISPGDDISPGGDDTNPLIKTSCSKDINHDPAQPRMEASCSETCSTHSSSGLSEADVFSLAATQDVDDQLTTDSLQKYRPLTESGFASFKAMPPKDKPQRKKQRPAPLLHSSKQALEKSTRERKVPECESSSTPHYWTLERHSVHDVLDEPEKASERARGKEIVVNQRGRRINQRDEMLPNGACFSPRGSASPVLSRESSCKARPRGRIVLDQISDGCFSPRGSMTLGMSREVSCTRNSAGKPITSQGCFSPRGSMSREPSCTGLPRRGRILGQEGCLSPRGNMSAAMSRESSCTRNPQPLMELVNVKLEKIAGRRASEPAVLKAGRKIVLPALTPRSKATDF